jgi:hypothetical protein
MAMKVAAAVESYGSGEVLSPIVDVEHGREVLTLRGHTAPVVVLEFDAPGRRLLSCGGDFTTRQWEAFPWREEEYAEQGRRQKST